MRVDEEALLTARLLLSETEYRSLRISFRNYFAFAAIILVASFISILRESARTARVQRIVTSLNVQLQNVHDQEARRIGRELHDSVGQSLAAAKMAMSHIAASKDVPQDLKERVSFAAQAVDDSMREIRTLSYLLHPPMLEELGFPAAAKWFVEAFSERSGITVNLDLPEGPAMLPPQIALTLFRALQVGLGNVHRHSQSKSANVTLTSDAHGTCLAIRDLGIGIPEHRLEALQTLPEAVGVGLGGLKERLRELHGTLEIISNSDGTLLRVRLPVGPTLRRSQDDPLLDSP